MREEEAALPILASLLNQQEIKIIIKLYGGFMGRLIGRCSTHMHPPRLSRGSLAASRDLRLPPSIKRLARRNARVGGRNPVGACSEFRSPPLAQRNEQWRF